MYNYCYGAVTDRGDVRNDNQDSILTIAGERNGCPAALFVLADGMGGLSYGAEVSRYITEQFRRWWQEDFPAMVLAGMEREEDIRELLEQEIWDINRAVFDFKNAMGCRAGSTLSLLLLYRGRYYLENIGDSRIYRFRSGKLWQLTEDQSVENWMKRKKCTPEERQRYFAVKNRLTMCIGMFPVPQSNYSSGEIFAGDCFLLCSDGLYNPLRHKQEQVEMVLGNQDTSAQGKADILRQMIQPGKAADNVSAIVVQRNGLEQWETNGK